MPRYIPTHAKRRNMTKKAAEHHFRAYILPGIKATERPGAPDFGKRALAWDGYTDCLCKDKQISEKQAMTWEAPRACQRQR
jgi:hypothetical protein